MEANLVRILLLIGLFFLLSSDYSVVIKQLMPIFEDNEEDSDNSIELTSKNDAEKVHDSTRNLKFDQDTEKALRIARKKILNAVKNSCLPKLICELNASPNKENLSQSELSLLGLLRDTSIMATAEITSKYHFAAHMGQLISGVEGTGCHNFYPDCPLPGFRVSQLLKNIRIK